MIKKIKQLWQDESAQGATEYILMLVVVVAIALMFKTQISEIIQGKVTKLGSDINRFE